MVCLDNYTHYFDIVVCINILCYALIFIPIYPRLVRLLFALNFGVLGVAVLQAVWPAAVPDNQLAYISLNLTFFALFGVIVNVLGSAAFFVATLLLLGPMSIAGHEHIHHWLQSQFGFDVSDAVLIVLIALVFLIMVLIYSAAEKRDSIQFIVITALYSFLAVFGLRILIIEYLVQADKGEDQTKLCCGSDYPDHACPFIFGIWFIIFFSIAFIFRLVIGYHYYNAKHKQKIENEDEQNKKTKGYSKVKQEADDADETQTLLPVDSLTTAATTTTFNTPYASRYLPRSRWITV